MTARHGRWLLKVGFATLPRSILARHRWWARVLTARLAITAIARTPGALS